ncbi:MULTISPECIES: SDR family NAD(P)-dependent oxidoreductase [Niastella]|uniref:3-oxoacyl-ACP reductase FabG n=1 Tax=Niastella soli TaxID=2821487 RepID=A0ABS3YWA6_9BACT|nr:3-oxoacyl-ACP reductase family protein [Niastella soli]MBO9202205.1 3-oxoacyl-ACP reductase FabG [Niastella soli]
MKRLTNKVVFITGGSRGIGAGIAKRMAAAGADVVITYVQAADQANQVVDAIKKVGQQALAIAVDNASPNAINEAVEKAVAAFGRIDILVNNAGIYIAKPLAEYTLADFDSTMSVNVRAVFMASQKAAQYMQPGGRIINIGSNMAERVAFPTGTLYSMSKSALIGLTKGLARDLGGKGITVNMIQPGPVDTDMNPANGAFADVVRSAMAIPAYGKPEDIGELAVYLASEESRFMTGASLTIDGGFSI